MFERDDVVNVVRKRNVVLVEQAVLTLTIRSLNDELAERDRDVNATHDGAGYGEKCVREPLAGAKRG